MLTENFLSFPTQMHLQLQFTFIETSFLGDWDAPGGCQGIDIICIDTALAFSAFHAYISQLIVKSYVLRETLIKAFPYY